VAFGCSFNAAAQLDGGGAGGGTGVTVNDPTAIGKAVAEYAEQAKRWSETLAQYQKQIAAYQQMISTFTNLSFQSLLPERPLQKMDEASIAQQACPGGSGNMGVDALAAVSGQSLEGPVVDNAQRLCVQVTKLKVKMYNDTVEQANRMPKYNQLTNSIDQLISMIPGSNSVGNTQKAQLEVANKMAKFQEEMQAYKTNMEAYRSMLETLSAQQSTLAKISNKGKPTPLGTVIQAGTFAAAFK
jgi:hypothetical protein